MADLQSFIQAMYPDRSPDEPQLMTPESAANRQTGRTQAEVDQSFPLLLRAMAAAQQHMVPPMGGASPSAQGARRFAPGERPTPKMPPPPPEGYGVKAGEMIGPERLRMLAQHYVKHPMDWTRLGGGTQGEVYRPPDHILDFLGLPPLTAKESEPYTIQNEAAALRALPNLQGQDLQKRYVGTVLRANQNLPNVPNRVDPGNPERTFGPGFGQGWLFTREVPRSEKTNEGSIDPRQVNWDRVKNIASEATRRGVRLGGDSFSEGNLWVGPQGHPRLMDSGYSRVNPVDWDSRRPLPISDIARDNNMSMELRRQMPRRTAPPPTIDPAQTIDRSLLE